MPDGALITTLVLALGAALLCGLVAVRLRLAPLVGYLVAGVLLGPHTPGFVADGAVAAQLANIGVVLLLFGVGIHFNLRDLLAVRGVALTGGVAGVLVQTGAGAGVALVAGWPAFRALALGLAISVASTAVLMRALTERDELGTLSGRIALGWVVVEDLLAIVILVLLPAIIAPDWREAGAAARPLESLLASLLLALGKVAVFAALMLVVGVRVVPWLLGQVARTGSRELFMLAVLVLALGIASGGAALFGVSLALGAFIAGLVVSETDLSHQAAAEALPLRDAFSVLFFVSIGMVFDPRVVLSAPGLILAVLLVILLGKPLLSPIVLAFGYPARAAVTAAAGLAQIGEFSFVLASVARGLGILPEQGYNIVVACALLSIGLNGLLFRGVRPVERWLERRRCLWELADRRAGALAQPPRGGSALDLQGHAVLCGYGRVGGIIGLALERRGIPFAVIEQDRRLVEGLRRRNVLAFYGDAANEILLGRVNLERARAIVVAVPDPVATRRIVGYARRVNPHLDVVVRTASVSEKEALEDLGVQEAVMGELELGLEMTRHTLHRYGVSATETLAILQGLRASWGRRQGESRNLH